MPPQVPAMRLYRPHGQLQVGILRGMTLCWETGFGQRFGVDSYLRGLFLSLCVYVSVYPPSTSALFELGLRSSGMQSDLELVISLYYLYSLIS